MRIEWEVVNGITGVISAVAAVTSLLLVFLSRLQRSKADVPARAPVLSGILGFILVSASWIVCVMSFNFIVDPFGPYVSNDDERTLFGVAIGLPAVIALWHSVRLMLSSQSG